MCGSKARVSTQITSISFYTGNPSYYNRTRKVYKNMKFRKEKKIIFYLPMACLFYIENLNKSTNKQGLIN